MRAPVMSLVISLLALAACAPPAPTTTAATTETTAEQPVPASDAWQASVSLPGTRWIMNDENPSYAPTIEFAADGRASGGAGCNTWSASYQASDAGLSFGAVATTKRMCPAPEMEAEHAFLQALADTQGARMEGDDLVLFDIGGAENARFHPLR